MVNTCTIFADQYCYQEMSSRLYSTCLRCWQLLWQRHEWSTSVPTNVVYSLWKHEKMQANHGRRLIRYCLHITPHFRQAAQPLGKYEKFQVLTTLIWTNFDKMGTRLWSWRDNKGSAEGRFTLVANCSQHLFFSPRCCLSNRKCN